MTWKNKIDLMTQSGQGRVERGTLEYSDGYVIEQPKDLITKEFVDILFENLPPDAESLQGKVLTMAGTQLYAGYLSTDANASYEPLKPAGSQVDYIINDPTFTLSTPNTATAVNKGDQGKFELWRNYYNAGQLVAEKLDEFDLAARFQEANRTTAQTGLPASSVAGKITVTSIEKYGISKYQKVNAYVTVSGADLQVGYNELVLKHVAVSSGGDQVSAAWKLFYDTSTVTPTVTNLDVTLQTVAPKWLSGVQYAGLNTSVLVDAVGNALYDKTYVQNPITVTGFHGMPDTVITPNDAAVSGLSNPPAIGQVMTVNDKVVALSVVDMATKDAIATGTPRDPFGAYTAGNSPSHKYLVNTFGSKSTGQAEYFDDELYRLPLNWNSDDKTATLTGNWDSLALLAAGNAQQGVIANNENGLLHTAEDFRSYLPTNTANYAGRSGDESYVRAFTTSSPKSSIQLVLHGIAVGISPVGSGDVNVEVKLPTQTGWLDCAKPYDGSKGVGADGLGAMVGNISYSGGNATLNATFGGKSSYDANNRVLIRVTLRNGNRTIQKILTNW